MLSSRVTHVLLTLRAGLEGPASPSLETPFVASDEPSPALSDAADGRGRLRGPASAGLDVGKELGLPEFIDDSCRIFESELVGLRSSDRKSLLLLSLRPSFLPRTTGAGVPISSQQSLHVTLMKMTACLLSVSCVQSQRQGRSITWIVDDASLAVLRRAVRVGRTTGMHADIGGIGSASISVVLLLWLFTDVSSQR